VSEAAVDDLDENAEEESQQEELPSIDEAMMPGATSQEEIDQEMENLREEFGDDLPPLLIDVHFDEDVADFFLEAMPRVKKQLQTRQKTRFYIHQEDPTQEFYLMVSPAPANFNAAWVSMQNPQTAAQAFEQYADEMLQEILLYPRYDEIDWQQSGDGMYTPLGLTKQRLIDTFFQHERNDPQQPSSVAFTGDEVSEAQEVAQREKPSF
jgi:hypothetical protein